MPRALLMHSRVLRPEVQEGHSVGPAAVSQYSLMHAHVPKHYTTILLYVTGMQHIVEDVDYQPSRLSDTGYCMYAPSLSIHRAKAVPHANRRLFLACLFLLV